jgi:hypothetical protein
VVLGLLVVALMVVSTCTSAVAKPAAPVMSFDTSGFHTQYPATWSQLQQSLQFTGGISIVWLSNQPIHDPCSSKTTVGGAVEQTCSLPLERLGKNGIVVQWLGGGLPRPPDSSVLDVVGGRPTTVGGFPAKLAISTVATPNCEGIGATRVMTAIVDVEHSPIQMTACLRGPKTSPLEAQVETMLQSTTFTP